MNLSKLRVPLAGCVLAALALGGCQVALEGGVEPIPPPPVTPASGTLTVRWLVVGTSDPALCSAWGARAFELVIYDTNGAVVADETARCPDFSIRFSLPEGRYTADATLIGPRNEAITTTKRLERLDVVAGTDLAIDLDFPRESMLTRGQGL